ncbi:MAG: DEAD/DEAH box helicase [Bacteroidales bacterium]|nr:DEAD/DEAH box helicase [Bacteroidales bacterium]
MTIVQQYLSTFKTSLQKLACLYAYIGQDLKDDDRLQLSVHGDCMMGELPIMTAELIKEGFVIHEPATHFGPQRQYIRPRMFGEVMRFGLETHPEWFEEFDKWPLTRYAEYDALQRAVRFLAAGKRPQPMVLDSSLPPYLLGLADARCFEPLWTMIRDVDFPAFIGAIARKWIKDDFEDPEEIMRREIGLRKFDSTDPDIREMKSIVNYYNYVCRGEYEPPTSIRMSYSDFLLKGVHAMSHGKSDLALKIFSEALNVLATKNKGKAPEPFITDGVAAFYWVAAIWTSKQKSESSKILSAFVANAREKNLRRVAGAVLLADTLSHPLQRVDMDLMTQLINPEALADREYIQQQRLCYMLAANLTGYELTPDNFSPHAAYLRHEAEKYITLNKFEKKKLTNAFGKKPTSALTKTSDPWELMLDRLIACEQQHSEKTDEGEHRVMYTIMTDGESVEVREQNRLKDGRWGSGKQLPWNRFISGTEPFMDRDDQAVVADVRFLDASRLTVGIILPHLVGSDRVYTGEQTPYRRVTIEEQKPYVILEPNDNGFHIQSNVSFKDLLSQSCVYRRDDAMHYTYFPMGDHEREVLQQLLSVVDYPPEAEDKLRQLLPLITSTTDIHSSLLPKEEEVADSEPQSGIILRLTPDPTMQTMFDAYVLVRPLVGGRMALPPAQGDRVIIDYSDETGRVRIERNLELEAEHLGQLMHYCQDHFIDLSAQLSAHLSTMQVLDLLAFASSHQDICTVEWPEGERLKMRSTQKSDWNISLAKHGHWFEVEGDIHLDDNSILSAQQLLQALSNSHGGYVQLQNGDYLWLSERLRKQLDSLESLTTVQNNKPSISTLQCSLLAEIVNGEIDIRHDEDFFELKSRIEKAEELNPQQPAELNATLRPYQLEGFQWLMRLASWGAGACLADDMGLGKTIQTISFLLAHADEGPALVVAPSSVVPNWRSELERFAPSLTVYNLNEYFERQTIVDQAKSHDVILLTYGLMVPSQDIIASREWNAVCLDEAHNIKNRGTKTSVACMRLQARYRLILTGTPVQNHLGELWNLFQFINPGLLGTYEQFHQKYILPIENMQDTERQQQLQTLVSPFMLRRTKQAVATELPDKTEININVELTDEEMAFYEVIRREAEQKVREEGNQLTVNALAELTRLRRTACSAELTNPAWFEGSSKVNAFMELVTNIVESGNSVIVFSQFTSFLSIVSRALKEAHLPHLYLDGSIAMKQREQLVNDFQRGKSPIFLISLKAGGVGLNLTAANYVIHLDPWWNPAIEQQATDRAHRIGQTKAVTVYHLISHHTIEEKIIRLHESKRALSDGILEGADQNYKLTSKDMLEMLSNQW